MLVVLRAEHEHLVGHVRDQVALSAAQHLVAATLVLGRGRVRLHELVDGVLQLRMVVGDRDVPQVAVLRKRDRAPVREPGDRGLGDGDQRALVVQVADQVRGRLRQEGQLRLAVQRGRLGVDAVDRRGTGVGEQAEEDHLRLVDLPDPGEGQAEHPDAATVAHEEGQAQQRPLPGGGHLQLGIAAVDVLQTHRQHHGVVAAGLRSGVVARQRVGRPLIGHAVAHAADPDQLQRLLVEQERERADVCLGGIGEVLGDDLGHRLPALGREQLARDVRQPLQPPRAVGPRRQRLGHHPSVGDGVAPADPPEGAGPSGLCRSGPPRDDGPDRVTTRPALARPARPWRRACRPAPARRRRRTRRAAPGRAPRPGTRAAAPRRGP